MKLKNRVGVKRKAVVHDAEWSSYKTMKTIYENNMKFTKGVAIFLFNDIL
jgi:hypothetical protein